MRPEYGYADGWRAFGEARVPLDDRAFMYGDAVFETLRVDPHMWMANAHWKRLKGSLKALALPASAITRAIEVAETRPATEGTYALRVVVSRGAGPGLRPFPQAVVYASLRPMEVATSAIALHVIGPRPDAFLPWHAKHAGYLPAIFALKGSPKGSEALWIDGKNNALESGTGNIVALFGDTYLTPAGSVLGGTTRDVLMRVFGVRQERLPLKKLMRADAMWVTSAINIARPVRSVNGERIPQSKSLTAALISEYRRVACALPKST